MANDVYNNYQRAVLYSMLLSGVISIRCHPKNGPLLTGKLLDRELDLCEELVDNAYDRVVRRFFYQE